MARIYPVLSSYIAELRRRVNNELIKQRVIPAPFSVNRRFLPVYGCLTKPVGSSTRPIEKPQAHLSRMHLEAPLVATQPMAILKSGAGKVIPTNNGRNHPFAADIAIDCKQRLDVLHYTNLKLKAYIDDPRVVRPADVETELEYHTLLVAKTVAAMDAYLDYDKVDGLAERAGDILCAKAMHRKEDIQAVWIEELDEVNPDLPFESY